MDKHKAVKLFKHNAVKLFAAINLILSLYMGTLNHDADERNSEIFENLMSITNEQINISHIFASTTQQSIELLAFYNSFVSQKDALDGNHLQEKEKLFNKKIQDYDNTNNELNNYLNQASEKIENRLVDIDENKYKISDGKFRIAILNISIAIISLIILSIEAFGQDDILLLSSKLDEIKTILSNNDKKYKKN